MIIHPFLIGHYSLGKDRSIFGNVTSRFALNIVVFIQTQCLLCLFQILSKYVNGLLNTKGGVLVFGVEPRNCKYINVVVLQSNLIFICGVSFNCKLPHGSAILLF